MKKHIAFLTGFFCFFIYKTEAQTSTIYFDKNWDTCSKKEAYYTRKSKIEATGIVVTDYYPSGKVQMTGTYKVDSPSKKQGYFKHYNEDGFITSEGNYINSEEEGTWKRYKEKGRLWLEEDYHLGNNNGYLKVYYPDGSLKRKERYENGKLWEGKCYGTNGKDTTFYPFREMPAFPGGEDALYQFLSENTRYPAKATKQNASGTVRVIFMVDTDGSLKDLKIKKPGNEHLDEEALRVVGSMPNWMPGKEDGVAIKVYFAVPLRFVLQ